MNKAKRKEELSFSRRPKRCIRIERCGERVAPLKTIGRPVDSPAFPDRLAAATGRSAAQAMWAEAGEKDLGVS